MDKFVREIVDLIYVNNKTDRVLLSSFVGFVSTLFFGGITLAVIIWACKASIALPQVSQEIVGMIAILGGAVLFVWFSYYCCKYILMGLIPAIQYGLSPICKNREESIESLMTSRIEDKGRMHRKIIKYLKEWTSSRSYAALHMWLCENHLLTSTEHEQYLAALKIDFPIESENIKTKAKTGVPSSASFSEQKTKLEKDDNKEYKEKGYASTFAKLFGQYLI